MKCRVRTGGLPFLELFAVGVIFYAADHEICQMAVFVSNYVEEPILQTESFFVSLTSKIYQKEMEKPTFPVNDLLC